MEGTDLKTEQGATCSRCGAAFWPGDLRSERRSGRTKCHEVSLACAVQALVSQRANDLGPGRADR